MMTATIRFASWVFFLFVSLTLAEAAYGKSARDSYAEARKLLQNGQCVVALEILRALPPSLPHLQDFLLFDEASCLEKTGDLEGALSKYREIVQKHGSSQLCRPAFRRLIALARIWQPELALKEYGLYLKQFPGDARILSDYARLLEESGQRAEALEAYREVFLSGTSLALEAAKNLRKSGRPISKMDLKRAADRLLEAQLYDEAITLFELFPPPDEEIRLALAKALFHRRRYREAVSILEQLPQREARLLLASSLARNNELRRFYRLMEELIKDGQKDTYSLHLSMAELKRREGNQEEAMAILADLAQRYPEKIADITWAQAWLDIRAKNYARAETRLAELVNLPAGQTDKNFFWLGRVRIYQGKDGSEAFLRLKDENGYYFLKVNPEHRFPRTMPGNSGITGNTTLPELLNTYLRRIADLVFLKMSNEALQETQRALPLITPAHFDTFAELMLAAEDFHSLVRLGIRGNILRFRYPPAFFNLVQPLAEKNGVDPLLVISLMREESHFRPDAVSRAGALGLMQLMPATARRFGPVEKKEELFDPAKNISLGIPYLAKLLNEFPSVYHALAAYNAGEGAVRRWLNASSYLDEDEFVEDIPFSETRGYVLRVMRSYKINKRLWGKMDLPARLD